MNKQHIINKIAQAHKWKKVEDDPDYEPYWEDMQTGHKLAVSVARLAIPDYTQDLNAMREVLMQYSNKIPNFVIEYERCLNEVLKKDPEQPEKPFYWLASAEQLSEAFIMWREGEGAIYFEDWKEGA